MSFALRFFVSPYQPKLIYVLDADFVRAAEARGIELRFNTLRELYRTGLLTPFVEVRSRRVPGSPMVAHPPDAEPQARGTLVAELRHARERGRLLDPALAPFRSVLYHHVP